MFTEHDDTIRRLQHEKSVWRAIAIGLAGTLVFCWPWALSAVSCWQHEAGTKPCVPKMR